MGGTETIFLFLAKQGRTAWEQRRWVEGNVGVTKVLVMSGVRGPKELREGRGRGEKGFPLSLVLKDGLSKRRNGRQVAIEVEALSEDDLEDFGNVDAVFCGAVKQGGAHQFRVLSRLFRNVLLLFL